MEGSALRNPLVSKSALFLALSLTMFFAGSGYAQLRTGRGSRSFYQNAAPAADGYRTGSDQRRSAKEANAVSLASHESMVTSQAPVTSVYEPMLSDPHYASDPYYEHSSSCSGCAECSVGPSCDGCSLMGCQDCAAGFGIAPSASGFCPAECGPILSLWYRLSVRAEVPLFWRRDQGPPALVTTSPSGTAAEVAGELGQATTSVLLGQSVLTDESSAGVRLTFSTWLGSNKCYGVILRYWNAGDQDESYNFDSNSFPILARPFFNTTVSGSEEQDTQLIAFPNESIGSISVNTQSSVDGIDLMLRRELYADRFNKLVWLWGYQGVRIDEGLTIGSNTTVTGNGAALQGTSISVTDSFQTENQFHGMSYGLMNTRRIASLRMETMFRLGVGNLERRVNISGSTTTTSGGLTNTVNQGLLARSTNSRPFEDDTFIVIPELAINLAYRIRPELDFNLGYNYMVIPKVAQAAQQLDNDLAVNLSDPLTGALDPQLDFVERRFWLHSLGFGLQLRY